MNNQLNLACRVYINGGLSLIPIRRGTKAPLIKWEEYQERRSTQAEVDGWLRQGIQAVGMVCGAVSGGVEVLDFDTKPSDEGEIIGENVYIEWLDACFDILDRYDLPVQRTGSGSGIQVAWRCDVVEGNQKLAWVPDKTQKHGVNCIIETRGEGGQALVPPSLHPSGGTYTLLRGKFSNIPRIKPDEREYMLNVARLLGLTDPPTDKSVGGSPTPPTPRAITVPDGMVTNEQVIDLYNQRYAITSALFQHGYTDAGHGRYSRPGKPDSAGVQVNEAENKAYAFSSNDTMTFDRDGGNQPFGPFDLFVEFDHGGDMKAALRAAAIELGVEHRLHTLLLVEGYEESNIAREAMFPLGWVVRTMNGKADVSGDFDNRIVWSPDPSKAIAVAGAIGGIGITMTPAYNPISMANDGILVDYLNAVRGGAQ